MSNARKNTKYDDPFAVRLRHLLDACKPTIKQETLANAIGVSRQAISQYRDGSAQPSFDKLLKIAEFFNVSTDYLLGVVSEPTRNVNIQQFCELTGLTENSVNRLEGMKRVTTYYTSIINQLINHPAMIDFLIAIWTHKCGYNATQELTEDDKKILAKYFGCKPADVKKYVDVSSKSVIESIVVNMVDGIDLEPQVKHDLEEIVKEMKLPFTDE